MTILLALLACNDSPPGDSADEPALTCREWCGVAADECDSYYSGASCMEYCDLYERDADEYAACWASIEDGWDIEQYGWDRDACYAAYDACGEIPRGA